MPHWPDSQPMIRSWPFWRRSDHVEESCHERLAPYPFAPLTAHDPVLHMNMLMCNPHDLKWFSAPVMLKGRETLVLRGAYGYTASRLEPGVAWRHMRRTEGRMPKRLGLILIILCGFLSSVARAASPTEAAFQRGLTAYNRQDYATALREWQPLAQHGNPAAQSALGMMYEQGRGVAQNDVEAVQWFRKAAAQGNAL